MYQKLDTPSTLRLIRVLPNLINDRIVCEIHTADPKSSPDLEYQALSYCWGDSTPTREIYLKNLDTNQMRVWPLHENLWQFLHQVQDQEQSDLLIWIDSLCLDQKNPDEISQQVPRMGEIYSQAVEVMMWLGADEEDQLYLARLRDCPGNERLLKDIKLAFAFRHVVNLEYWNRLWIVQEVVLARDAYVFAGDVAMDFADLDRKLDIWIEGVPSVGRLAIEDRGPLKLRKIREAERIGKRLPLWQVFQELYTWRSTNSADAVYGLLGIVGDHEDGTSPKQHIMVDYTKRPIDVLFDTIFEARAPVSQYRDLLKQLGYAMREPRGTEVYRCITRDPLALQTYLESSTISARHRDFATLASRVYDATIILSYRIENHDWVEAAESVLKSEIWNETDITARQRAALVGFSLAVNASIDRYLPSEKNPRLTVSSPWRCARHQMPKEPLRETWPWRGAWSNGFSVDETVFQGICGGHTGICEEGPMAFLIPEIGFGLMIKACDQNNDQLSMFVGFCDPFVLQTEGRR